jgi:hypothetical protein
VDVPERIEGSNAAVFEARSPIWARSSAAYSFERSRSSGIFTNAGSPR